MFENKMMKNTIELAKEISESLIVNNIISASKRDLAYSQILRVLKINEKIVVKDDDGTVIGAQG